MTLLLVFGSVCVNIAVVFCIVVTHVSSPLLLLVPVRACPLLCSHTTYLITLLTPHLLLLDVVRRLLESMATPPYRWLLVITTPYHLSRFSSPTYFLLIHSSPHLLHSIDTTTLPLLMHMVFPCFPKTLPDLLCGLLSLWVSHYLFLLRVATRPLVHPSLLLPVTPPNGAYCSHNGHYLLATTPIPLEDWFLGGVMTSLPSRPALEMVYDLVKRDLVQPVQLLLVHPNEYIIESRRRSNYR